MTTYSNQLIDKRVVERNIAKGLVDPELHKQQLEALPDTEPNAVSVSLDGDNDTDDDIDDDIEDEEDIDEDDDEDDVDDEGEGEAKEGPA